jgi:hypothetical protein
MMPAESEVLLPPQTYLGPVREKDENGVEHPKLPLVNRVGAAREREIFIDNLLVRVHLSIEMS